jgi:putative membrane protein
MIGDWTAVGDQAGSALLGWLALGIPLVFAALLLVRVLRAMTRQDRYRAVKSLGEADQRAVHEALAQAERRTVGEILPVVVGRSDAHPAAEWLAALSVVLIGSAVLVGLLPWRQPLTVLLSQVGLGALGFGLARWLPDFKRMFIREDRATEVAEEQAFQEFYRNGLHRTEAATGVLLFVSLLEHRVVILADDGIDSKVDAEFWADTDDAILDGIRRGSLRDGLIAGIRRAGELLAGQFPWQQGDRNEIPDRVIVREE